MKTYIQHIIFFSFFLTIISCSQFNSDIPNGIIPKDKMVEVITEIELTQAFIKLKLSNKDTINKQQLLEEVYNELNTSEEQFNNSLTYYSQQPAVLETIYVKVINNLSKKQAEIQKD